MIADAIQILSGLRAELFSGLTFFLGFWLGHRLQLGRDRIRELNAAVVPVRAYLLKEIELPGLEIVPAPSLIELDTFEHYLHRLKRAGFRKTWEEQKRKRATTGKYDPATGKGPTIDKEALRAALRDCLRYTNRR